MFQKICEGHLYISKPRRDTALRIKFKGYTAKLRPSISFAPGLTWNFAFLRRPEWFQIIAHFAG
jgi:hypothetical protein